MGKQGVAWSLAVGWRVRHRSHVGHRRR